MLSKTSQHAIRLYHANMDGMTTRPIVMTVLTTLGEEVPQIALEQGPDVASRSPPDAGEYLSALRLRRGLVVFVRVCYLGHGRAVDDVGVFEMIARR